MLNESNLWLLRHAKSDWSQNLADFDRPLNPRGRKSTKKLAEWLKAQSLKPDLIVASPAARARETIERLCRAADWDCALIRFDDRLYEAGVMELKQTIENHARPGKVLLLVGHNPGFEGLLHDLVVDSGLPPVDKLMPTAALARFKVSLPLTPQSVAKAEIVQVKSLS